MRGELKLFSVFTLLLTQPLPSGHSRTVPDYACGVAYYREISPTDICRRFANRPPKRLIFDRRTTRGETTGRFFPTMLANGDRAPAIRFQLSAYFARFFNRLIGCSPSQFRQRGSLN